MSSSSVNLRIFALALLFVGSRGLNGDGILLLSFKHSVLSDPLSVLRNWDYNDSTPCSWSGVNCGVHGRVTALALPDSELQGWIPANLGLIEHLRTLDLSNNSLNGSLPLSLFNASRLQSLDLSGNSFSGGIPAMGGSCYLVTLNLSDNALSGVLPENLGGLGNLTVISLRNNQFSGALPGGFDAVGVFDVSSNLIDGSLPSDLGGERLHYLNASYNRIPGRIPPGLAARIPENATVDLAHNNITGEIPDSPAFHRQGTASFSGNLYLCGKPLSNPCPIPSAAEPSSSPAAIAVLPTPSSTTPVAMSPGGAINEKLERNRALKVGKIAAIVVGDLAGITLLVLTFLYITRKRKKTGASNLASPAKDRKRGIHDETIHHESKGISSWLCSRKKSGGGEDDEGSSEAGSSEDGMVKGKGRSEGESRRRGGKLVTVDGGKEMEEESLLRASAYILGASGRGITYKAVLEDGSAVVVRRIGDSGSAERVGGFEAAVRAAAKWVHPNLVRVRGFYWGDEDKLVIYDYVPNGCLANVRYRKAGSSPCYLSWEARLKIARGVARGLAYLHDKKHVHGNLKPSNILLGLEMEPRIGNLGLERLVSGDGSYRVGGSMRIFGSHRSNSFRDHVIGVSPSLGPSPSPSSIGCASPYHAPESLRNLKPSPKWDVYSFGVVLLELLTGKAVNMDDMLEMGLAAGPGAPGEERGKILRTADVAIRADVEGREDALLACLQLGLGCASQAPQKRPSMKEAVQVLEKASSSPSSSSHRYGH